MTLKGVIDAYFFNILKLNVAVKYFDQLFLFYFNLKKIQIFFSILCQHVYLYNPQ